MSPVAHHLQHALQLRRWGFCRFLAVAVALWLQGCGDLTLQPWHTAALTEEFTAATADEVRTFEDYQLLEERLFAQLEEKVIAPTETGPAYALLRYSKGSAADPRQRRQNWNRSFELPADSAAGGVLLLHGMSDSPYSLRALGLRLRYNPFYTYLEARVMAWIEGAD